MKSPIETKDGKTTIDNVAVNGLTQRFLAAIKAFTIVLISQATWDRIGLEKTWKFFLPLCGVAIFMTVHYLSYYGAVGVIIITCVWLFKKAFKK
jgi:hypothetical protein